MVREIQFNRMQISVRWHRLFFPIPLNLLVNALEERKWVLPDELAQWGHIDQNLKIRGGVIARKGGLAVHVNTDKIHAGVFGRNPKSLISAFEELESIFEEILEFESQSAAWFYEYTADGTINSDISPIKAIHDHFAEDVFAKQASRLLGLSVAPYAITLSSTGAESDGPNWFECRIGPIHGQGIRRYTFNVVYRHETLLEVSSWVRSAEDRLLQLVDLIEGQD